MSFDLAALEQPITRILTAPGIDLATISAKRVRKTLLEDPQYAFLGLTPETLKTRRSDVDQLIARIFEGVSRAAASNGGGATRKRSEEDDEEDGEGDGDGDGDGKEAQLQQVHTSAAHKAPRLKKKNKNKKSVEESDAALARKLSSEINGRSRRGASSGAGASSPRKARGRSKKSAAVVDSGEEDEDGEPKPKKRGTAKGGFAKEYMLSTPLSVVLGVEKLSRPQVVKKLWEYIRENELQNPLNKREIMCDGALRAVFAVDKIDMFRMNKELGQHLHQE